MVAEPLRIAIVTPAARGSQVGNRVTALRWAGLLRQLGHRPRISSAWRDAPCDALITVHAVKSAHAVRAARQARPDLPIITLLSGTDIYPTFAPDASTLAALRAADALIALQPLAAASLPADLRDRVRTVRQSATAAPASCAAPTADLRVCLLAHLRPIKAPLLAVRAVAALPPATSVTLTLAGRRLDAAYGEEVVAAAAREPRVTWIGALDRGRAKRLIADSAACLVPSAAEGGANVVSEAIAAGTPVLCSDAPGNLGLLGADWPGAFQGGDVASCTRLLQRAASDPAFVDDLRTRTAAMQPMVAPAAELAAWRVLLDQLIPR